MIFQSLKARNSQHINSLKPSFDIIAIHYGTKKILQPNTKCIYVFRMVFRIKRTYFLKEH